MVHVSSRSREYLIVGTIACLILVSLPLAALLVLTLRGVIFLAAGAAVICGLVGYAISPAFREWLKATSTPRMDYKGLELATDVTFHPSHSWARMEGDVLVGVDDLVQATLGPVEEVELPAEGCRVRQGERLFRLRHGKRMVDVRAPLSGTVLGCNAALRARPELINADPFARGWVVRLRSDYLREDQRRLLRGKKARTWFRSAVDRVVGLLSSENATAALADRDALRGSLYQRIDDVAWHQLTNTVFTVPPAELGARA